MAWYSAGTDRWVINNPPHSVAPAPGSADTGAPDGAAVTPVTAFSGSHHTAVEQVPDAGRRLAGLLAAFGTCRPARPDVEQRLAAFADV